MNPFAYVKRHGKTTSFTDEAAYNQAIVEACLSEGIEVIGLTDHHDAGTSVSLGKAARDAGIHVFPGFEVESSEGVHFLCLFDEETEPETLDRYIGALGVFTRGTEQISDKDACSLLKLARDRGGACVAAHADLDKGLLRTLAGKARVRVWTDPSLRAAAVSRPLDELGETHRRIIRNLDPEYRRDHPVGVIHASDVSDPSHLSKPTSSCWVKMSHVSVDGLNQAFLDPESRVRLYVDPKPAPHTEFVALAWQAGFLDDLRLHLNENLNVLIGGRGAGKSTVLESLRYVLGLEPKGTQAKTQHESIVRRVLRSGTKISLLVRTHQPSTALHLIERTVPNPPVVRDEHGETVRLLPEDLVKGTEIFGQHEISELANDPERLTLLLERFVDHDDVLLRRKKTLTDELEESRRRLLQIHQKEERTREQLDALPALEATINRYREAGLEERLRERSLLVREERILESAGDRVRPLEAALAELRGGLPLDRAIVSEATLSELPNRESLRGLDGILERLSDRAADLAAELEKAIAEARTSIEDVRRRWSEERTAADERYEEILRELQRDQVDGEEFIRLRSQIERLRPLREQLDALEKDRNSELQRRRDLVTEWEDVLAEEFRRLERAAKRVSKELETRLRVRVFQGRNRQDLLALIDEYVAGRRAELRRALEEVEHLSLRELAEACRAGARAVMQRYRVTEDQARRLAEAPRELFFRMEELALPAKTMIELNVGPEGEEPVWQPLDALSTGQKATALLLLLLTESDAPLVIDQPEDDLDNRFIVDRVVKRMKEEKRRRQFIFATHNANIPVLGDAELIVGLTTTGDPGMVQATVLDDHLGSIDEKSVRHLVEDVLEGGREAFMLRQLKYDF